MVEGGMEEEEVEPIAARRKRAVSVEEGERLAEALGCPFMECSARTGLHVEQVFLSVVERIQGLENKRRPREGWGRVENLLCRSFVK